MALKKCDRRCGDCKTLAATYMSSSFFQSDILPSINNEALNRGLQANSELFAATINTHEPTSQMRHNQQRATINDALR